MLQKSIFLLDWRERGTGCEEGAIASRGFGAARYRDLEYDTRRRDCNVNIYNPMIFFL